MAESVAEIMQGFACRTGLGSVERPSTRYLWTDAFAVCNGLGLFVDRADEEALRRALLLVEETHHVLGRHRPDDGRDRVMGGSCRPGARAGGAAPRRVDQELLQ